MSNEKKPNLVWIELEKPRDKEHAEEICMLANHMMSRLAKRPEDHQGRFKWSEERRQFMYGSGMGYRYLTDRGEWFDLDYLGTD